MRFLTAMHPITGTFSQTLAPVALTAVVFGTVIIAVGACAAQQGAGGDTATAATLQVMNHERSVFKDTVFLSDFATHAAAGLGGGTVFSLPPVLTFDRCDFRAPVRAGRHRYDRIVGGSLSFAGSTFAAGVDLRGLSLAHDLTFHGVVAGGVIELDGIRTGGALDLRRGTFRQDVRLPSASVAELLADRAHFEGGLSLQRARFRESGSLVEAEVDGYLDASYLTSYGGLHCEHLHSRGRANFDYAEVRGRWSFHGAELNEPSFRFARAWTEVIAFPEGVPSAALEQSDLSGAHAGPESPTTGG